MVSFSRLPRRVPAACSPSLSVVSNTATLSDIVSLAYPRGVKNPADLLGRDGEFPRHSRHFAFLPLPDFGNDDAGELFGHLPKGSVFHCSITPCAQQRRSEEHTSELQSLRHLVCR